MVISTRKDVAESRALPKHAAQKCILLVHADGPDALQNQCVVGTGQIYYDRGVRRGGGVVFSCCNAANVPCWSGLSGQQGSM